MALVHYDGGDLMSSIDSALERSTALDEKVGKLLTALEGKISALGNAVAELEDKQKMPVDQYIGRMARMVARIEMVMREGAPAGNIERYKKRCLRLVDGISGVKGAIRGISETTEEIGNLTLGAQRECNPIMVSQSLSLENGERLVGLAHDLKALSETLPIKIDGGFEAVAMLQERLAIPQLRANKAAQRLPSGISPRHAFDWHGFYR